LELIQERLKSIEQSIKNISSGSKVPLPQSSIDFGRAPAQSRPSEFASSYVGDSSFGVQTKQATIAVELLSDPAIEDVASALASLRNSLETNQTLPDEAYVLHATAASKKSDNTLPPMPLAIALMKKLKGC